MLVNWALKSMSPVVKLSKATTEPAPWMASQPSRKLSASPLG